MLKIKSIWVVFFALNLVFIPNIGKSSNLTSNYAEMDLVLERFSLNLIKNCSTFSKSKEEPFSLTYNTTLFSSFDQKAWLSFPKQLNIKKLSFHVYPSYNTIYPSLSKVIGGVKLPFSEGLDFYYSFNQPKNPFKGLDWNDGTSFASTLGVSFQMEEALMEQFLDLIF